MLILAGSPGTRKYCTGSISLANVPFLPPDGDPNDDAKADDKDNDHGDPAFMQIPPARD